ncbi:MAG TPA: porin [Casimicrobiaceae bacterium]
MRTHVLAAVCAVAIFVPIKAHATDGYFSHGYGMKAKGMGGASIAVAQDAFGGANNPGTMAFAGDQFAIGVDLFSPWRKAERSGSPPQANLNGSADSGSNYFGIPEIGYNTMVRPDLSLGVTVYGNGGMNTDYPGGQIPGPSACQGFNPGQSSYNLLCGSGKLGVDLSQLVVAPTVAWRFLPDHAIGIAPLFAYQRFKLDGLQAFDNPFLSTSPGNVTNKGYDSSIGWGVRVGYYGQLTPQLAIGATYASKISMGNFDKYRGLFAESGGFDIPANWGLGVAFKPMPAWLLALDYGRIEYSDVKSVGNPSGLILQCMPNSTSTCLGGPNGAGFGWHSIDVWKLGVQYQIDDQWTVRAGYNHSDNPIRPQDVTFNILAPGVVVNHLTLGTTYNWDKKSDLTAAFMYAFNNSVQGASLFNNFFPPPQPAMQEKIQLREWALGIQYSHAF